MNTFLMVAVLWMFIGQLSLNVVWTYRDMNTKLGWNRYTQTDYIKGLVGGCLLGPFTVIFAVKELKELIFERKEMCVPIKNTRELMEALAKGFEVRCDSMPACYYVHLSHDGELLASFEYSDSDKFNFSELIKGPSFYRNV